MARAYFATIFGFKVILSKEEKAVYLERLKCRLKFDAEKFSLVSSTECTKKDIEQAKLVIKCAKDDIKERMCK